MPEPKERTVVARRARTFVLGTALFAYLDGSDAASPPRLVRVHEDGALEDVARDVPTTAGEPTALLGEPEGPIWAAFARARMLGSTRMYRADAGRWRCVARCGGPSAEPWDAALIHDGFAGFVAGPGSRGHVFLVGTRPGSVDGAAYALPRADRADRASTKPAVAAIRPLAGEARHPLETADGAIVDLADFETETRHVRSADGVSRDDMWIAFEDVVQTSAASIDVTWELAHVASGTVERVGMPERRLPVVLVGTDGTAWLGRGPVLHRFERGAWRPLRIQPDDARGEVLVWASARALFTSDHEDTLHRLALP